MHRARLFIGIPITDALISELQIIRPELKTVSNLRWVPNENLHITLLFIGETDVKNIDGIKTSVKLTLQSMLPFELIFDKFAFMPAKKPYMIWARYKKDENFEKTSYALHNIHFLSSSG